MFELALHGWDIRSSLDIQPSLSYESIPVLMEFASLNRAGLIQPTSPLPTLARYRLHLTGVATGDHDIVIEHGEAHAEPAATTAPDAGIETDTETFVLLTTGRIGFEAARDDGRLVVVDGSQLPPHVGLWFKGVWPPSLK